MESSSSDEEYYKNKKSPQIAEILLYIIVIRLLKLINTLNCCVFHGVFNARIHVFISTMTH